MVGERGRTRQDGIGVALRRQFDDGLHGVDLGRDLEPNALRTADAFDEGADGVGQAGQHQRIVAQPRDRHAGGQGRLMACRCGQDQVFPEQGFVGKLRRRGGVVEQGQVHPAGEQPFADLRAQAFGHRDGSIGKILAECLHQRRRQHARYARGQADHDLAGGRFAQRLQILLGALGQRQQGAGVFQESQARFRGLSPAPIAVEQMLA